VTKQILFLAAFLVSRTFLANAQSDPCQRSDFQELGVPFGFIDIHPFYWSTGPQGSQFTFDRNSDNEIVVKIFYSNGKGRTLSVSDSNAFLATACPGQTFRDKTGPSRKALGGPAAGAGTVTVQIIANGVAANAVNVSIQ
jgi:hypothetical protein